MKGPFAQKLTECDKALRAEVARGAGANPWIVDHFPDLHAALRDLKNAVPARYYKLLPKADQESDVARIEQIALDFVEARDADVDGNALRDHFADHQQRQHLTLAELWAAIHMVRYALLARAARGTAVEAAIKSFQALEAVTWKNVVEKISFVERILREDPSGDYARMDFETRDSYRHEVEKCGRGSRGKGEDAAAAEERVARTAVGKPGHVGYWLVNKGREEWRRECGYRHKGLHVQRFILRHPALCYLGSAALLTAAIVTGCAWALESVPGWCVLLLPLPAIHVALAILNPIVTFTLAPRRLPRYDFSDGVPAAYKTFVAVPTLLLSRDNVESLLENVEIHYLANRDPNILFALLTDFADSKTPEGADDHLVTLCAEGIEKLNARYATPHHAPFYLFHRPRLWNESEGAWMGRERKRGKLNDFNRFLLDKDDAFAVRVGDLTNARGVKFVITLDSDTQLPRDTARKMIATLAHPLNVAVLDEEKKIVREGYGLLLPRVGVSIQSSVKSRLARIYSGQVGYDPYATTVSDVYQDLFGRASFTGKGIYDVAAFELTAGERFPDNTLLSHDLIEGEHARVGLVADQEVIDDFPARYEAFSKRKHRWVRGDWQILEWLLPRVPAPGGGTAVNPLGLVSRWKIFDNLRRSLMELAMLALFLAGWTVLPGSRLRWTLVGLALFVLPVWFDLVVAAIRIPPPRFIRAYFREVSYRFARGHMDALLTLTFLPHQAMLMGDAIARTLVRRFATHRNLLEWESMAAVESAQSSRLSLAKIYLYGSPVLAVVFMFLIHVHEPFSNIAFAMLELWLAAPLVALWLDSRPSRAAGLSTDDVAFLRDAALKTWRYFTDFATPESHWLAPDNVQETPPMEAHRTSPTNIGLQLNTYAAALDFGHMGVREFAELTARVLESMSRLPRFRGHFLNWYDTRQLTPLDPRYVSSVDSGNLAASLIVTKQACLSARKHPLVGASDLQGLRDHVERLRNELPQEARSHALMRTLESLARQLASDPSDLFFWEGLLTESLASAKQIAHIVSYSENPDPRYWCDALLRRIEATLDRLCRLAPWLRDPCEKEFRFCFTRPIYEPLLKLLREPLTLDGLASRYDAIEEEIGRALASHAPMHELTRNALEVLSERLPIARKEAQELMESLDRSAATAAAWVEEMDFASLFDAERMLLRIGCGTDGAIDESSYDLLASEARTAVLLGIAKGQLPRESWFHLGRKITRWRGAQCLVSWSGTMFEYLMPNLFMRTWEGTLLHESCRSVIRIQKQHARERRVPWGVSESAYNTRDSLQNYQYHAFGVPVVAARRDFSDRLVISPYATMLALTVDPASAMENARLLAGRGWLGRYGFYEAIDYTRGHRFSRREGVVVRAWMAHHQGMTLLAINAALDGSIRKWFHADPLVQAAEYLLQERAPELLDDEFEEVAAPDAVSDHLQSA